MPRSGAHSRPEAHEVMSRHGFTLIELLIVVVIIGILAAIAIPKFANTKEKAYIGAMKSDLRNLATAEEAFFYDSATYTNSLVKMNGFQPSSGVAIAVNEATAQGWSATASSNNTTHHCYLYSGGATPIGSATVEGHISCS
ncbi:MAG: pilin [Gemmatimonadetes bacterium]|nr:MAG: pilin [Gemmatimonadota bacterium]